MKRGLVIGFTLLVTGFITCNFFVYKLVLKHHKKEFKKTLLANNTSEIEVIAISPSQLYADSENLEWLDENKEVKFHGEMFDIVRIKNYGDKVLLYVINDKREKQLFSEFKNQFSALNNEQGNQKKDGNFLVKFLTLEYDLGEIRSFVLFQETAVFYHPHFFKLSSGFASLACPPPDLA